jgi:hypothetical protein
VTALRERLAAELATKVERHGVVIWDDPDGVYAGVVDEVMPKGASLQKFDGSWFDLRHRLEKLMAGQDPPAVVAYLPSKPLDPDPLEELRALGTRFCVTLTTLIRTTLDGQISEQRILQYGQQCLTIGEAEAVLDGDDTDAGLISVIGETSTSMIVAHVIAGTREHEIVSRNLIDVTRQMLSEAIGGAFDGLEGTALRHAAFRQIVLTLVAKADGALPDDLSLSVASTTAAQRKTCASVVEQLQTQTEFREHYIALADAADHQLHLGALLPWGEGLRCVDATEAIEILALGESFRLLEDGNNHGATDLAEHRLLLSWWLKPAALTGDMLSTKYRAVRALAQIGIAVDHPVPVLDSISELRNWYEREGWEVDSAYRHSELIRVTSGVALDELDELYRFARQRYETWLDQVLRASADAMSEPEVSPAVLQRTIHTRMVGTGAESTAYVLVDALRYELGVDLAERLRTVNAEVEIVAAVGTPPSITTVGMAAVLPRADTEFRIDLDSTNRLQVVVGGSVISGVRDRVRLLEHTHGTVVDLLLDDVAQYSNRELKKKLDGSSLVLVRSTEIDTGGESDQLAASWGSFDMTLKVLQTVVAKLLHAGIRRVVITADHGFLAVRQLGEDRRIDRPSTGFGELHRRAWIGRGGTGSDSTIKIPLSAFGIAGDLDIITPRGLGVFTTGGGLQFFHGGLSPQELIVPVIVCTAIDESPDPKYQIELSVAGERITTGVLAATLTMTGDLFTRTSRVRVQLMQNDSHVGMVVGGDGVDRSTETINVTVDTPLVISLRVTANLIAGSTASLEVLDAATGVRLESMSVEIATNIIVEDQLD